MSRRNSPVSALGWCRSIAAILEESARTAGSCAGMGVLSDSPGCRTTFPGFHPYGFGQSLVRSAYRKRRRCSRRQRVDRPCVGTVAPCAHNRRVEIVLPIALPASERVAVPIHPRPVTGLDDDCEGVAAAWATPLSSTRFAGRACGQLSGPIHHDRQQRVSPRSRTGHEVFHSILIASGSKFGPWWVGMIFT